MSRSNGALLGERLAEGDTVLDARAHQFERAFGETDEAHAMMNTAWPEPSLRDLEAATLSEQHVPRRDSHVVERDFGVPVRGIVEAEDRQHPLDLYARRVHRHQNHRLLFVFWRVRVANGP